MGEEDIIGEIEALLKKLDLKKSDFEKKTAHPKAIEAFNDFWFNKYPYIEKYSLQDVDFVGRERQPEGRILVAMEVDVGWWRALRSCVKLANLRAENKIWIHITDSEDAKEDFQSALKDIQKLLKIRAETKESFGNFIGFLKTPNPKDFQMKRIF